MYASIGLELIGAFVNADELVPSILTSADFRLPRWDQQGN
jgi:hypothetical protein